MDDMTMKELLLENLPYSIVLVDLQHIIRYLNKAGRQRYAKWGNLIGESLFLCHNEKSRDSILNYVERLKAGEDEILYVDKPDCRVYLKSVREANGSLAGYYEWVQCQQ